MLRYTEEHEWLKQDGDEVIVGITEHAAEQLGDLVFVELPERGHHRRQGRRGGDDRVGEGGERHHRAARRPDHRGEPAIVANPALVNEDPMEDGWFFKMTLADPSELDGLMDEEAYRAYIA